MESQDKELLEKTFEYARENNKILRAMRRSMRVSSFLRVVYWILIIGAAVWLYSFLQPFIETLTAVYGELGGLEELRNLLNNFPVVSGRYNLKPNQKSGRRPDFWF